MFEWDEQKRLVNLRDRGVDFAEAALIFENEVFRPSIAGKIMGKPDTEPWAMWMIIIF